MHLVDWIGFSACSGLVVYWVMDMFRDFLVDLRDELQVKLDDGVDKVKGYVEKKKGEEFKIKV